jgi:hypothetical protein
MRPLHLTNLSRIWWACDYRWGMDWIYWPLLYTTRNYSWQITDTHRLVPLVCYSLHNLFPGNGFCGGRFFSFPCSGPLVIAACAEICKLTAQLTGSQAGDHFTPTGFQLTTELCHSATNYSTSHHSTELLTTDSLLHTVLLITAQYGPHRKHSFHCYSPTVP